MHFPLIKTTYKTKYIDIHAYVLHIHHAHPPTYPHLLPQRLRDDAWIDKGTRYFKIDFVAYLRYDFLHLHVVLVAAKSTHTRKHARGREGRLGCFQRITSWFLMSHVNMSLLYCKFLSHLTRVSWSSIVLASAVLRVCLR